MDIVQNISLRDHSTMRLGGSARYAATITSRTDLTSALAWAETNNLPVIMVGGGSNIIWKDGEFSGLLLINKCMGFEIYPEDTENYYVTAGAGENWDSVVERVVQEGLTGIESLSLIPGSAGATPVQNVGAYGQEISNVLTTIEAYDTKEKKFLNIPAMDCDFGYRTSRFKTTDKGRFFITAITLHLRKADPEAPSYKGLAEYFGEHPTDSYTPQIIRDAVIAIRSSKLPDPAVVANNGSFFANPIIDEGIAVQLRADYPTIPYWTVDDDHIKLPAAWLIEQVGLRDYHDEETGMATWSKQALVFVNEHAQNTADLLKFKQKVITAVEEKFGITLEQEPELLP
jgi:UDP-N-acetylmuramate dehydrogenase